MHAKKYMSLFWFGRFGWFGEYYQYVCRTTASFAWSASDSRPGIVPPVDPVELARTPEKKAAAAASAAAAEPGTMAPLRARVVRALRLPGSDEDEVKLAR
jgi:hypothetical protein